MGLEPPDLTAQATADRLDAIFPTWSAKMIIKYRSATVLVLLSLLGCTDSSIIRVQMAAGGPQRAPQKIAVSTPTWTHFLHRARARLHLPEAAYPTINVIDTGGGAVQGWDGLVVAARDIVFLQVPAAPPQQPATAATTTAQHPVHATQGPSGTQQLLDQLEYTGNTTMASLRAMLERYSTPPPPAPDTFHHLYTSTSTPPCSSGEGDSPVGPLYSQALSAGAAMTPTDRFPSPSCLSSPLSWSVLCTRQRPSSCGSRPVRHSSNSSCRRRWRWRHRWWPWATPPGFLTHITCWHWPRSHGSFFHIVNVTYSLAVQ